MSGMIRLVYASRAKFKPAASHEGIEPTVARILMHSRSNNPQHKIGGVLYYGDGYFFQCLEGDSDVVDGLMAKIMQDSRHTGVQILKVNPVEERIFKNWSMKYIPLEEKVAKLLSSHDMDRFNPYEFSAWLIDDMVELFAKVANPESQPDQDYTKYQPAESGWIQRLLGFFH